MRHTKNFEIMMPLNAGGYLVWVLVTLKSQFRESLIIVQHMENSVSYGWEKGLFDVVEW